MNLKVEKFKGSSMLGSEFMVTFLTPTKMMAILDYRWHQPETKGS